MAHLLVFPWGFGVALVGGIASLLFSHFHEHKRRDLDLSEQPVIFRFNEASIGGWSAADLQGLTMNMTAADRAVFSTEAMGEKMGNFSLDMEKSGLGLLQGEFAFPHPLGGDLPISGLWTTYTPPALLDAVREHFTENHARLSAIAQGTTQTGTAPTISDAKEKQYDSNKQHIE